MQGTVWAMERCQLLCRIGRGQIESGGSKQCAACKASALQAM
jgi:hypothetical protein